MLPVATSDTVLTASLVAGILLLLFASWVSAPLANLLDNDRLRRFVDVPKERGMRWGLRVLGLVLIAAPIAIAWVEGPQP